jgi:16S rRNA pseudouridine516 synthase
MTDESTGPAIVHKPVSIEQIVVASGLVPRRRLRKHQFRVEDIDGARLVERDSVVLGDGGMVLLIEGVEVLAKHARLPVHAMHKPLGCITSRRNEADASTVFDIAEQAGVSIIGEPIGRLDKDTTGVLLFAFDGDLLHRLTHPKRAVPRVYVATLDEPIDDEALELLRQAKVVLDDGHVPKPTSVERLDDGKRVRVTLTEGKYHEVRRMFAALGRQVVGLLRESYGPISLGDRLRRPGVVRELNESQLEALYASVGLALPPFELLVLPTGG